MPVAGGRTGRTGRAGRTPRWLAVLGVALVLAFAAIAWVQWRQISLLSTNVRSETDNLSWSFFQLEAQYLQLRDGLRDAARRGPDAPPLPAEKADELRQRFELLASRLPLIAPERTQGIGQVGPEHPVLLARLDGYVRRHEALLGEAATAPLTAPALAPALADLEPLAEPIHDLALQALQLISELSGRRNDAVRDQIRLGIGLTVFQSLLTLAFAGLTVRQFRTLQQRRQELEALATHLGEARAVAESASLAKSAFLANMSHELRTPFNGMMGMLALLESSRLDAEQADHVRTARTSAAHLLDLLNDILDVSKLESGRLDIVPHPLDLHRLIGEVRVLMLLAAEAKGLALAVDVAPGVPEVVVADGKRLKQILFNLMSNAVKFTDHGRVRLTVSLAGAVAGAADDAPATPGAAGPAGRRTPWPLRFTVEDTGIGIDEQVMAQLFRRFTQGDASTSRRYGGTGLGLEISRSLARLMGGDITVASTPGQGAAFTLALSLPGTDPQALARPAAAQPVHSATARGAADAGGAGEGPPLDLLVADDHPVNRKFMAALLGRMGHKVRLANDGAQAVAAVQTQVPDLIFMDLHMPVQDGFTAARLLRAQPGPAGRVPIVALTADVFNETRDRVAAAGMDAFLTKPVQPDAIEDTLVRVFGARARQPDPEPPAAAPAPEAQTPAPAPAPVDPPPPEEALMPHDPTRPLADPAAPVTARRRPAPVTPATPATTAAPLAAAAPAAASPAAAPRRRFKASDVALHLDMAVIGDVCVGVTLSGYQQLLDGFLRDDSASLRQLLAVLEAGDGSVLKAPAHAVKGAAASLGLRAIQALARGAEQDGLGYDAAQCQAVAAQLREHIASARALCQRMGFL